MDAAVPKQIGRYTVDRLLGAGAMGYVFLGRDPQLDRPVAIKTVRDLGMDVETLATFLERFRNEARAAARLQHPNIVQVYDVGEDDEAGPYLVFEYVAGSTLKQLLRGQGPLEPAAACRLAAEVAGALTAAHERGIIHRDIKPDNLLMTPSGEAKLADFGVARVPNAALTREGQFLGTPCYAAPETLSQGRYGVHSDLFSFAAMLYEVVTGARAFPGTDAVAVAHMVIHDEPAPARQAARRTGASVPKQVEAVLIRALDKDPESRFPTAQALSAALRGAYVAAGLVREATASHHTDAVADPLPMVDPTTGGGMAFGAVVLGGLLVGVAVIFALNRNDAEFPDGFDLGVHHDLGLDGGAGDIGVSSATQDASIGRPSRHDDEDDAGAEEPSMEPDQGAETPPAEAPDLGTVALSPHEREEAAKDALDEARVHLRRGRLAEARRAIVRARRMDPENADITVLRAELERLQEAADGAQGSGTMTGPD